MKTALFSLAFVAASGAYVAAANHMLPLSLRDDDAPMLATDTAAPARPSKIATPAPSPVAPAASVAPYVAPSSSSSAPAPVVAEVAPVPRPALPRPRPAPPALAIQSAAATDTAAAASAGYRDGTYTGSDENAYYGRVQVQVTVTNHQIASVKVLDYPQDRRTSRYINSQALPQLKQEVIAADSSNIDTVSGATLTSEAYIRSLDSALQQAGGSNA